MISSAPILWVMVAGGSGGGQSSNAHSSPEASVKAQLREGVSMGKCTVT